MVSKLNRDDEHSSELQTSFSDNAHSDILVDLFFYLVGMCESRNPKYNNLRTSSVEELDNPIPGLFRVLTEEPDPSLRWTTYTYPAHLDLLYFKPRGSHDFGLDLSSNLGQHNTNTILGIVNKVQHR